MKVLKISFETNTFKMYDEKKEVTMAKRKYTNIINLRNVDPFVFSYLTAAAASMPVKTSRESYVKMILENHCIKGSMAEVEDRYNANLENVLEINQRMFYTMNEISLELQEIKSKLLNLESEI